MNDSNVGMGMVPCKPGCRCDECVIERQEQRIAEWRSVATGVAAYLAREQGSCDHEDHSAKVMRRAAHDLCKALEKDDE